MADIRQGQDILDICLQLYGRLDEIGDVLAAAEGIELPGSITVNTDNRGDERVKLAYAIPSFVVVNTDFGIIGSGGNEGIGVMQIGTTFIIG